MAIGGPCELCCWQCICGGNANILRMRSIPNFRPRWLHACGVYGNSIRQGEVMVAQGARAALLAALPAIVCIAFSRAEQSATLPFTYPAEPLPNTNSLYFGLLQSFGGTYNGSGSIPGIQLALDNINEAQTLLPGYTLQFVLRDSFVSLFYIATRTYVVVLAHMLSRRVHRIAHYRLPHNGSILVIQASQP